MPKVSVIVPAYNAMNYLPQTITNVLKQTYQDFEIVIINDGSTDNIQAWIAQINDAQVKLVSQSNQGLAGARNRGIQESVGEYLAFLDADDLWEHTKLAKQVEVLDGEPEAGLVYTWVAYIDEVGNTTGRVVNNLNNQQEGYIWRQLTKQNLVECGSVAMIRRECFTKCGVFDQNLGSFVEDWDMWLRIAKIYPFKVIKEPLVYYRQVTNSASRNWEAMTESYQLVIEKAFATAAWSDLPLRNRSYGTANLVLGWKALQSQAKNYQQAAYFRSQAFQHDPKILFSKEYLRLSVAIAIMRWFGINGYQQFITFLYGLRRSLKFSGN
jgi:glycosyltransferase involved in cell wall biosynthesis